MTQNSNCISTSRQSQLQIVPREDTVNTSGSDPFSAYGKEPAANTVPLLGIVMSLCDAMDLVSPSIVNHHHRVAYIAHSLAKAMGWSPQDRADLLWAGLLHDGGAFSLRDRLAFLDFELTEPGYHAELGYRLLSGFEPFSRAGRLIRFHHTHWDGGRGTEHEGLAVDRGSHVLHLADRLAVTSGRAEGILSRTDEILERMRMQSGRMFVPELVDVLESLAAKYHFWLDLTSPSIRRVLEGVACESELALSLDALRDVARVLCRLIDFRSRFTSTHSRGVAVTASNLGRHAGLPQETCWKLEIAGYVHDLGKLAVPLELLEKAGKFSREDFATIKTHPYHTYRVLGNVPELGPISQWASLHHERLDGKGYPFCLGAAELCTEARIVAVADVFTALGEDRPYRKGMSPTEIVRVLERMSAEQHLDGDLVSMVVRDFEELNDVRSVAQAEAAAEYQRLWSAASG